jgi:hypothetical protein
MAVGDDNRRARDLYIREGYSVTGPYLDEYDFTEPGGATVRVSSPAVLLRKAM